MTLVPHKNGFALVMFLSTLPVLLILLLGVGILGFAVTHTSFALNKGRQTSLQIQSFAADRLSALLSLNRRAYRLERQSEYIRKLEKSGIKLVPQLGISVSVYKASIIALQLQLRGEQDFLKRTVSVYAQSQLRQMQSQLRGPLSMDPPKRFQLAVVPIHANSIASPYQTAPQFERVQSLELQFQFSIFDRLPKSIRDSWREFGGEKMGTIHVQTAATLEEEKQKRGLSKWKPKLGRGKFSWN